jgi:ferrous iron transport protein A
MFTPFSVTGCSLKLLRTGERGIVTFCKSQDETILNRLISTGLIPGTAITLEQNFPLFSIKTKNTFLTLNAEMIQAIYVRIIDN